MKLRTSQSNEQTLIDSSNCSNDYLEEEEEEMEAQDQVHQKRKQPELLQLNKLKRVEASDRNESIFFLGLFELSTKTARRKESEGEVSAAQLAVDHVNKLGVLPGYTLRLLINDTKVCGNEF